MHIFILGHANESDGRLSAASESRISFAVSVLEDQKPVDQRTYLVATGGFGDGFNTSKTPHHVWVEAELKKRGLSSNLRSGETLQSEHTVEDAILIKNYCTVHDVQSFLVVTNEFHLARTKLVFEAIFNPLSVNVLAAENPTEIGDRDFAHERDAIERLEAQGGVFWRGQLYPLISRPGRWFR